MTTDHQAQPIDAAIAAHVSFMDLRTINDTGGPMIHSPEVRVYNSSLGRVTLQVRANAPIEAASRHAKNLAKRDLVASAAMSVEQLQELRNAIDAALKRATA